MINMDEYEEAGEAFGRLLLKFEYPRVALVCITIAPIITFIGFKFLFV